MQASQTIFQHILEGTKQYVIPLFQRSYSWEKKHWEKLWKDLIGLYNDEAEKRRTHFIGSLVTMQVVSVPQGVPKFLLIDGQQRYTTLSILLIVMRDLALGQNDNNLADDITELYLTNKRKEGQDFYKLQLTQIDRKSYYGLVKKEKTNEDNAINKAYNFFYTKIRANQINLNSFKEIITGYLSMVGIVLEMDKGDDPYLVFESLNATGLSLTQSDLIRNYFFMRIHTDKHDTIYEKYWLPMQSKLDNKLQDCVRHYLIKDEGFVKEADVYFKLKDIIDKAQAEEKLKDLAKFSGYYSRLLDVSNEPNKKIAKAIARINQLQVTTSYPFFLNCYEEYDNGTLSIDNFLEIFKLVENFMIRRIICNIQGRELNKLFPELYRQAKKQSTNDLKEGVRLVLQNKEYPRDAEFRHNFLEAKMYGGGEKKIRTKLILETIEEAFNHKEQTNLVDCSIEHIMPQTLNDLWKNDLGEHYEYAHEMWLDNIGNLTLTKYNSELSNKPFTQKKDLFKDSKIGLNNYFTDFEVNNWTVNEIKQRAEWLAEKAISIWSYFGENTIPKSISMDNNESYTLETMHNADYLEGNTLEIFEILQTKILQIDNHIKEEIRKQTIDYKRGRSLVSIVPLRSGLRLCINLAFTEIEDKDKLCRDVSKIGHWGTGEVEFKVSHRNQIEYALYLIQQVYQKDKITTPTLAIL
jgi:uncharacterized protein with ParB-like and HNH nuclease domain/predicted transport protein